ncbi:MAG: rod-binding protein [Proteobacteria bacterium]|jgi:Rod binding domain-containing protein|nr:rod-binding protein [Pseudomonadota bacterium]
MDIKGIMSAATGALANDTVAQLEKQGKSAKDLDKIKKLSSDFESMFVEQMLKGMRSSVQKSGLIDGGNAEEIYTSMLDAEYAKSMANQKAMGLADMVERQLLESMGVKLGPSQRFNAQQVKTAYAKGFSSTLQEAKKPVTIESKGSLAQPSLSDQMKDLK